MKILSCRDLGGPCDAPIEGESFEEVGGRSREHVMEQIGLGDSAHQEAVDRMMNASPTEQASMMAEFERRFAEAPEA